MTKQIVIKLNEKKFKPLFDKFLEFGNIISKSYSETTEKSLYFTLLYLTEKLPELNGKTKKIFFEEAMKITPEQNHLDFLKKFNYFINGSH